MRADLLQGLLCPEGWEVCSAEVGRLLCRQLAQEVRSGHPLHNKACIAVLRSRIDDDVLFASDDPVHPLAQVHLTCSESDLEGTWPATTLFASVADWNARPSVVELAELPRAASCCADALAIWSGSVAYVSYEVHSPEGRFALLRFDGTRLVVGPGPNDEAFHNHPLYQFGLQHYAIQELRHSPWIPELHGILHKDGVRPARSDLRHFVLALKECSVDVIAESVRVVGEFASCEAAMLSAVDMGLR